MTWNGNGETIWNWIWKFDLKWNVLDEGPDFEIGLGKESLLKDDLKVWFGMGFGNLIWKRKRTWRFDLEV